MRGVVLLGLAGCQATKVAFVCPDGAPLCDTIAVIDDERPPAKGVDVSYVYVYQGNEVVLVENGEVAVPDLPIVAGRDALFRIGVTALDGFAVRPLTARVKIFQDGGLVGAFQADFSPKDFAATDLASTGNVIVKGGALLAGEIDYRVEILEASADATGAGPSGEWAYPGPNDAASIVTSDVGASLRIHIVPIHLNKDDTTPDLNADFMAQMAARMSSIYPAPEVELVMGDEYASDVDFASEGDNGWGLLLGEVAYLRTLRKIPGDEYMYGLFSPNTYGGGIAGLSNLGGPQAIDELPRSSIGLATLGPIGSADVMAHEVGHAHGRPHSPGCGAGGPDPEFPYDDGSLGRRGYDRVNGFLLEDHGEDGSTVATYDLMTYCGPTWVSDYNFVWFHDKIKLINDYYYKGGPAYVERERALAIREIWFHQGREPVWGQLRHERAPYEGERVDVEWLDGVGARAGVATGTWKPFEHGVPGGILFVPEPGPGVRAARVDGRVVVIP